VLLVDDEPDLREIFGMWLERAGCCNVYTAKDGEAALAIFADYRIDLLITDLRMPIMDGITLVRSLAMLGAPTPSIVFVSGFGDIDQREMYDLGVEAFLSKPIPPERLIEVVTRALEERAALWSTPMEPAPQQSIETPSPRPAEIIGEEFVHLGRGGFSTRYAGPLTLGKVAFNCPMDTEQREIIGQGYVRWRSRSDDKVGVEIAFLDLCCRRWVLEEIDAISPQSFIPSMR
jgi:CheY-like chemotaxis protein